MTSILAKIFQLAILPVHMHSVRSVFHMRMRKRHVFTLLCVPEDAITTFHFSVCLLECP